MLILSTKFIYYFWALFSALGSFLMLIFYFVVSLSHSSYSLCFVVVDECMWDFSFSLLLNSFSFLFTSSVLFITFVVMLFSLYYMSTSVFTYYFSIVTMMFVASMIFVINISDLIMLMLGWDGLGVVSFFLIVHYQSSSVIFSGLFTVLINRLGDALIMVSIILISFCLPTLFPATVFSNSVFLFVTVLVVGLMTNSAIFPFSPWLPAAMAAPTPISSLVHSSTLVTAGLYLIIRFSVYLYSLDYLCYLMIILGLFTSFYAGVNSLFEVDLNNLVALSTLSHLGFICLSLFSGYLTLSFMHLLSHAMFNSLLFMTVGGFMLAIDHYQDSRYLSSGSLNSSFSSYLIVISSFSLLGFPFMSGFYSNDIILESLNYHYLSFFLILILYLNVVFTYIYTMRIFLGSSSFSKISCYSLFSDYPKLFSLGMILLAFYSVFISTFYIWTFQDFLPVFTNVSVLKFYPLFMSIVFLAVFSLLFMLPLGHSPKLFSWASTMIYLSIFMSNITTVVYVNISSGLNNTYELGFYNDLINFSFFNGVLSLSYFVLNSLIRASLFICLVVFLVAVFYFCEM